MISMLWANSSESRKDPLELKTARAKDSQRQVKSVQRSMTRVKKKIDDNTQMYTRTGDDRYLRAIVELEDEIAGLAATLRKSQTVLMVKRDELEIATARKEFKEDIKERYGDISAEDMEDAVRKAMVNQIELDKIRQLMKMERDSQREVMDEETECYEEQMEEARVRGEETRAMYQKRVNEHSRTDRERYERDEEVLRKRMEEVHARALKIKLDLLPEVPY